MISSNEIELVNFFIFNPKLGQNEGEEYKKILFYYPQQTNKDIQLKTAGLCEALIKFTESFNPDKPCHSFHTEKTKQFLYEPEKDHWIVMTVSIPASNKDSENQFNDSNDHLVQDNVFEAVLRRCYKMYKIFNGTFKSNLGLECNGEDISVNCNEEGIKLLKEKLGNFYNKYLVNLKLANCDILDVFQGISFLSLAKEPFLHIQSFINVVETKFKSVKYSIFLYDDQLVWSGINSEDMQIIYQYLIFSLLPSHLDLELQGGSVPSGNNATVHHYGSFVTGPSNLKDSIVTTGKVPKVYLTKNEEETEIFHLVVYRALSATLCLFIDEEDSLSLELFKSLDSYLGPNLTTLVSEVSEHCLRFTSMSSSHDGGPKVLYFNKLNLAQKSTMHTQSRKNVNTVVSNDILRIISELNAEKSKVNECGEVMMLTLNECWLVGRFSNFREFYVIFTQKKGTLIEINDEVKKLCDSQLKGIFFTD